MFWWHLTNLTFLEDKIERALATLLGERPSKKKPFVAGHSIFGIRDSLGMLVSILNKILFKILLGDTIQTTYYLINQLPSFILHKKIPYSVLFLAHPLFLRLLRVFGCVCFVYNISVFLDPQSIKCVFLGYSKTQKGHKCFDPMFRKYLITVDVTFFKTTLFF